LVSALLMTLFALVQLNDPDAALWFFIYIVPAILAAVAAFRLPLLATPAGTASLGALVVLSVLGVIYYWPTTPGFWHTEVWWETETAREGMGMMITAVVMIIVFYTAWSARRRISGTGTA
ncbi:MAG TPA: transmembrane 220 family protein, partial [Afifellaceae bacterium]|nr:transmembrane 220 family protein [Afifellaceae bacterium]